MRRVLLLADDSVTIRKIVELTFGDTDIRVESVASGREAIDRLAAVKPDVVLADVVMPGPSGYDVCRAVKASARPVPVLLLAGTFEPFDPEEAKTCGSDGHVTKPFDSRLLVERVEDLLARKRVAARPAAPAPQSQPPVAAVPAPAPEPAPTPEDLDAMFKDLAEPPAPQMIDVPEAALARPEPARLARPAPGTTLSPADVDAIARVVIERMSERILREIAWDVVPDLAEAIVRERIRELERDDRETR
jgi:CheY-like chemotaxis protein